MKLYKHIIVTAISAVITIAIVYGGYSIYAASDTSGCKVYEDFFENFLKGKTQFASYDDLEKFYEDVSRRGEDGLAKRKSGETISDSSNFCPFSKLSGIYHDQMNEFFNGKFKTFTDIVTKDTVDTFMEDERFFAPEIDCLKEENRDSCNEEHGFKKRAEIEEKCKDNISSYCISMVGLYRYMDYAEIVRRTQKALPMSDINNEYGSGRVWWADVTSSVAKQKSKIEEEFGTGDNYLYGGDAYKVLKGTLIAYDEFKTAYPMHIKYDKIIKDLIKYKQKLKDIRNKVLIFPSKFTDITSITCP